MKRCHTSYVIRKWQITQQWDPTTHLLERPDSDMTTPVRIRVQNSRNSCSLLLRLQETAPLEESSASLTKPNTLTVRPATLLFRIHPNELETCPYNNLHVRVYSSFAHNCQAPEATKMSFSRRVGKWVVAQADGWVLLGAKIVCQAMKGPGGILLILTWKKPAWKSAYCVVPSMWHFGKGKTVCMDGEKSVIVNSSRGESMKKWNTEAFRAGSVWFYTCHYTFAKTIGCTRPRGTPV